MLLSTTWLCNDWLLCNCPALCNLLSLSLYAASLGKIRMVWKNLKKGKHIVTVKAFCTDNQVARKKFQFKVR